MSKIENLDQNYSIKKIDKETINIKVHNNDILISVVGEFNSNLNELEKLTKTRQKCTTQNLFISKKIRILLMI